MAKTRNNVSKLIQHVSSNPNSGLSLESLLKSTTQASSGAVSNSKIGSSDGMHSSALSASDHLKEIQFGHPSSSGAKASSSTLSSSGVLSALGRSASGGVENLLGNVGNLGGIGSLVTTLFHLFGGSGKSTPPPLVRFQLPSAQEQTAYVSFSGQSTYSGNVVENGNSQSGSGSYGATSHGGGQAQRYQSGEIAQAVKTALLTSSTLNDVISEI